MEKLHIVAYCFFLVCISVSLMLQGFLKTRNSSWLSKILAPKDLLSLLHAYVATQWLELWSNKKRAGFTFSCFLGMPVLASEPCLSPPLLRFCGCWGFLSPLPRSRVTGAAAARAASLPSRARDGTAAPEVLMASRFLGLSPQQASLLNIYFHPFLIFEY